MICAAKARNLETVKLLLKKGAEINTADNDGCTALMRATDYDNTEIVKLLLEAGANPSLVDDDGYNALAVSENEECANSIKTASIVWKQAVGEDLSNEEVTFRVGASYRQVLK